MSSTERHRKEDRKAKSRNNRYQYCWTCRTTEETQKPLLTLETKDETTTPAQYRIPLKKPEGLDVWTDEHSGQRYRFTQKISAKPSKYRVTYPWLHSLLPPHAGHSRTTGQGYALPNAHKLFTSTGRC